MSSLNPEQFGMTQGELDNMAAKAKGEHMAEKIWGDMEGIFGNLKVNHQSHNYDQLSTRFGVDNVVIPQRDSDDEHFGPYVSAKEGPYEARYHNAATIGYYKGGREVSAGTDYDHAEMSYDDLRSKLRSFIDDEGEYY